MKRIELINSINELGYEKFMELHFCYIPKNVIPSIYVPESLYWLRFLTDPLNKERKRIKSTITLIDLYLISSTPYERYAERNFLSYYDDHELYNTFGRIGNYLFPEEYKSKHEQLDAFVAFSKFRFGYFALLYGDYIEYIKFKYPIPTEEMMERTLMKITDIKFICDGGNVAEWSGKTIYNIPILQLYLLLKASWTYFTEEQKKIYNSFIKNCENLKCFNLLTNEYNFFNNGPFKLENFRNLGEKKILEIPINFKSIEQKWPLCLMCNRENNTETFPICGHGICICCSEQCPFCNNVTTKNRSNFQTLLEKIREMKFKRNVAFDFIGNNWKIPLLKNE